MVQISKIETLNKPDEGVTKTVVSNSLSGMSENESWWLNFWQKHELFVLSYSMQKVLLVEGSTNLHQFCI